MMTITTTMKPLTTNSRGAGNLKPMLAGYATAALVALGASSASADVGENFGVW